MRTIEDTKVQLLWIHKFLDCPSLTFAPRSSRRSSQGEPHRGHDPCRSVGQSAGQFDREGASTAQWSQFFCL